MSRTHKDRAEYGWKQYYKYKKLVTGPKLPKHKNTTWQWLQSTPSWWTRLTMNRPMRRACRVWEQKAKYFKDFEASICPDTKRKPHVYYY